MIKDIKKNFIDEYATYGFTHLSRVSMLSDAFPTNFTPSGGEEHLNSILKKDNPSESFCVIQPCFRYQDINNVSTGIHSPLFEMGVAISVNMYSLEDLISHFFCIFERYGLSKDNLTISVLDDSYIHNKVFQRDYKTVNVWKKFGINDHQFVFFGKEENFFLLPKQGYAGIKTEVFYNHFGIKMEIAVFITISNSVKKIGSEFYLTEFAHKVVCHGIGIERWGLLIAKKQDLIELYDLKLCQLKQNKANEHILESIEFQELFFLYKSLLFFTSDGVLINNESIGRKKLLRRVLKKVSLLFLSAEIIRDNRNYVIDILIYYTQNLFLEYPDVGHKDNMKIVFELINSFK